MSDLFIDFRPENERNINKVIYDMLYFNDMKVDVERRNTFAAISSRPDDMSTWGPCRADGGNILVCLVGRIALNERDWEEAKAIECEGGLATKYIYSKYKIHGKECFKELNGNFVIAIFDENNKSCHVAIDRSGMCLAFVPVSEQGTIALSSHPDLLASTLLLNGGFDLESMAEFIAKGSVSYPNTYYNDIKALNYGAVYTFNYANFPVYVADLKKYYDFRFQIDKNQTEWDCAAKMAEAFQKAMNKRVNRVAGKTAMSLSGGLDSRTLLCSVQNKSNLSAFTFFDEQNFEYRTAKKIADAHDIDLIPLKRGFDYYGDSMENGAKISGGMSNLNNNHFLGFRDYIGQNSFSTVIAGFYCDYLFKSLTIDKYINKISMLEKIGEFKYQSYIPIYLYLLDIRYKEAVQERLDYQIPNELKHDRSDEARLERAHRRIFPFYYEPDSSETTIPQRTMGWYLPIVDNDLLEVYQKIPPLYRLNASVSSKTAYLQCRSKLKNVPDTNTYVSPGSGMLKVSVGKNLKRLRKKISQRKPKSIATEGSWPNRAYYIRNSKKILHLFEKESQNSFDIINSLMNKNIYSFNDVLDLPDEAIYRILTLKLWIENRFK